MPRGGRHRERRQEAAWQQKAGAALRKTAHHRSQRVRRRELTDDDRWQQLGLRRPARHRAAVAAVQRQAIGLLRRSHHGQLRAIGQGRPRIQRRPVAPVHGAVGIRLRRPPQNVGSLNLVEPCWAVGHDGVERECASAGSPHKPCCPTPPKDFQCEAFPQVSFKLLAAVQGLQYEHACGQGVPESQAPLPGAKSRADHGTLGVSIREICGMGRQRRATAGTCSEPPVVPPAPAARFACVLPCRSTAIAASDGGGQRRLDRSAGQQALRQPCSTRPGHAPRQGHAAGETWDPAQGAEACLAAASRSACKHVTQSSGMRHHHGSGAASVIAATGAVT